MVEYVSIEIYIHNLTHKCTWIDVVEYVSIEIYIHNLTHVYILYIYIAREMIWVSEFP